MCTLVFFQANGQAFPETESKHPSLRAGAGYNIIDAGGSGTKYYSSLQERHCTRREREWILCPAQTSNRELLPLCTKPLLVNARSVVRFNRFNAVPCHIDRFFAQRAKSFSVISHHSFQPVFKCRVVNPCLRKLAFTHSLIELETQPYRTLRGKGGKCCRRRYSNQRRQL